MQYSDILRRVKTVNQARKLSSEIDVLLDDLFKTPLSGANAENGFEEGLKTIIADYSEMLKEALQKNNIQQNNQTAIKAYLKGLKEEIQKLKEIKLTFAFEPSQNSVDKFFDWVYQNLGDGIVLDISLDKSILGGTIIEYEGKYQDLSLRKKMEEVFGEKREEIITTIR